MRVLIIANLLTLPLTLSLEGLRASPAFAGDGVLMAGLGGSYSRLSASYPTGEFLTLAAQFNQLGVIGIGSRFGKKKEGLFLLKARVDHRTYTAPSGFTVDHNSKMLFEGGLEVSGSSSYFKGTFLATYSREPFLIQNSSGSYTLGTMDVPSVTGRGGYYLFNVKRASANLAAEATYFAAHNKSVGSATISSGYGYGGLLEAEFGQADTRYVLQGAYRWTTFHSSNGLPKANQASLMAQILFAF